MSETTMSDADLDARIEALEGQASRIRAGMAYADSAQARRLDQDELEDVLVRLIRARTERAKRQRVAG